VVEGTEIARTTTTTTIPPAPHLESTSTIPVQLVPPVAISRTGTIEGPTTTIARGTDRGAWQGQRFEIGQIEKVASSPKGWVVALDREEMVDGRGTRTGRSLTADPISMAANPPTVRNASQDVSLYYVSADAPVNEYTAPCEGGPAGVGETVPDLATYGIGRDVLASLTFDHTGLVTAIRMTHPC
jgi:hypothetical protein